MKSDACSDAVLAQILAGEAAPWQGLADLYASLHDGDPTRGNQATSEATYPGYKRVSIKVGKAFERVAPGYWQNAELIEFSPVQKGSRQSVSYLAIGTAATGAGFICYVIPIGERRALAAGDIPTFKRDNLTMKEK